MDTQTTDTATTTEKRIQVNAQLTGEVADAFERYRTRLGVGLTSAAVRALIVPQLRALGYLPAEAELQPADCN